MLTADGYRAWKALVERGLAQYGLKKSDLSDQQRSTPSARDLTYERAGVQKRAVDPLRNLTRDQMRRFVENALSRRCAAETARLIIWRIMNAKVTVAWRRANNDRTADEWLDEVLALTHRGVQYVIATPPPSKGVVRAYIHPKGVETFVLETMADIGTLIPARKRPEVAAAMIASIERHNEMRAKAVADWFMQSDGYVDVRVYEGPWRDPRSQAEVQVRDTLHRRVKPFEPREPLGPGERAPEPHERLRAVLRDTFIDSDEPQASRLFVVDPIHVTSIAVTNGDLHISAESDSNDEESTQT